MGRALKISKYSTNSGVGSPGAAVGIDIGFPNFGSLTDPVVNSADTLSAADYLGVVGGWNEGQVSATNPVILCVVNIQQNDGTATTYGNGVILRQKGSHKFLVAKATNINDEDIVAGNTYMIVSVDGGGTATNWVQFGAGPNASKGDIFTATISGSAATLGDGYVWAVGQCVLSNTDQPAAGYMSIAYSVGDSSAVYASYITNKWIRDWSGMTYDNYSASNLGLNIQSGENFYPVNFFSDEGTVTWSGANIIGGAQANNGSLQLAQVDKLTS